MYLNIFIIHLSGCGKECGLFASPQPRYFEFLGKSLSTIFLEIYLCVILSMVCSLHCWEVQLCCVKYFYCIAGNVHKYFHGIGLVNGLNCSDNIVNV